MKKIPENASNAQTSTATKVKAKQTANKAKMPRMSLVALREMLGSWVMDAVQAVAADRRASCAANDFELDSQRPVNVLVAFSGGKDSTALADVLARLAKDPVAGPFMTVTVVHIHHGLSKNADAWSEHAQVMCKKWRLPLIVEKVYVNPNASCGVEAAAREARYHALLRIAKEQKADVIMTAHHLDDRLETFLIQWIRGAGLEGLSAMTPIRPLESVVPGPNSAVDSVLLARPWLDVPGQLLHAYVAKVKLSWVEDDSNSDSRYLRNLIRNEILPKLDDARPGWRNAAARSVQLVADASQVVRSSTAQDLQQCLSEQTGALAISKLLKLPSERQALCLRAWLSRAGLRAPNRAKTVEILRQLRESQNDTKLNFRLENKEIRRWADKLVVCDPAPVVRASDILIREIQWQGESEADLGIWGGVLKFVRCNDDEDGIDAQRLMNGHLEVRPRKGGEKIKLHRLRPSRNLKQLFQDKEVAAFDRSRLPLVWLDGELVYVAGLGMEVREFADKDLVKERIRLVWQPDKPLLSVE